LLCKKKEKSTLVRRRTTPAAILYGRVKEICVKLRLWLSIVVGHLQPSASKAAFEIETLVWFGTVEDALITTNLLGNVVQRLDKPQSQLFALLLPRDGNVLDMADDPQRVDELSLDDQASGADDKATAVADDDQEILVTSLGHEVVTVGPLLLRYVADGGQDTEHV